MFVEVYFSETRLSVDDKNVMMDSDSTSNSEYMPLNKQ